MFYKKTPFLPLLGSFSLKSMDLRHCLWQKVSLWLCFYLSQKNIWFAVFTREACNLTIWMIHFSKSIFLKLQSSRSLRYTCYKNKMLVFYFSPYTHLQNTYHHSALTLYQMRLQVKILNFVMEKTCNYWFHEMCTHYNYIYT